MREKLNKSDSYSEILVVLGFTTLEERRSRDDQNYKIVKRLDIAEWE